MGCMHIPVLPSLPSALAAPRVSAVPVPVEWRQAVLSSQLPSTSRYIPPPHLAMEDLTGANSLA